MYKYKKRTDPLDSLRVLRCEIIDSNRELVAYVWNSKDRSATENAALICEALNQFNKEKEPKENV